MNQINSYSFRCALNLSMKHFHFQSICDSVPLSLPLCLFLMGVLKISRSRLDATQNSYSTNESRSFNENRLDFRGLSFLCFFFLSFLIGISKLVKNNVSRLC